jgi:prolipoprotein diacylglyceryltransferase
MSMGQILSLPMIIIGLILMVYAYKNNPVMAFENNDKKVKGSKS